MVCFALVGEGGANKLRMSDFELRMAGKVFGMCAYLFYGQCGLEVAVPSPRIVMTMDFNQTPHPTPNPYPKPHTSYLTSHTSHLIPHTSYPRITTKLLILVFYLLTILLHQ
jgi:hypothetical protein